MSQKQISTEDKLRKLYQLQLVDSKIDDIVRLRGALPLEVKNLETAIEKIAKKSEDLTEEIAVLTSRIAEKQELTETSGELLRKYTEQQKNVRNNREFESLKNEIEYQELEIQHCKKIIDQAQDEVIRKQEKVEEFKDEIDSKTTHLNDKKIELNKILEETNKEEDSTRNIVQEIRSGIDEVLLNKYDRIRNYAKNGLAIASVENSVALGSFFVLTPQLRIDVGTRRKIITDPYSGRILVDSELANEEKEKMAERL